MVVRRSAFAGYRFPPAVIPLAARWYLRFGLSYRDIAELLAERGVEVDQGEHLPVGESGHAGVDRCARPCRHAVGGRWFVDETCARVAASGGTSTGPLTSTAR